MYDSDASEENWDNPEETQGDEIYPFTRKQLAAMLSELNHTPNDQTSPNDFENIRYVPQVIKEGLVQMDELGYDFWYSSAHDLFDKIDEKPKTFWRPCYLRMQCQNCWEQNPNSRHQKRRRRRWTTSAGTIQLKFKIVPLEKIFQVDEDAKQREQPENYKQMVSFKQRIYRMKCAECLEWGRIFFYKASMDVIKHIFCRVVAEIVRIIPPPPKKQMKLTQKQLKKHQIGLCQACDEGVCVYGKGMKTLYNKKQPLWKGKYID